MQEDDDGEVGKGTVPLRILWQCVVGHWLVEGESLPMRKIKSHSC